jgi:phosphatidylserine/phosphatidylglycerophosphate/cardiolipin synthase-like enzyme
MPSDGVSGATGGVGFDLSCPCLRNFWPDGHESLQSLFVAATTAIDVAMFHIAFPSDRHPTRRLLDALKAADARGVAVRVLIDRDRAGDPYRSTLINSRAKTALEAAGVPVRYDPADRLLHSKFVVIDRKLAVVGSHKWSAGSYFDFDDLTLVLSSTALATEFGACFESMWNAAP